MKLGDVVQLDLSLRRGQSDQWQRVYGVIRFERGDEWIVSLYEPPAGVAKLLAISKNVEPALSFEDWAFHRLPSVV